MAKIEYVRCPRCELNYIDKREKLCKVCKMELESNRHENEEEVEQGICPICRINVINDDEEMCPMCAKEREVQQANGMTHEDDPDESWRSYVENDDTETEGDEIGEMSSIQDEDELMDDMGLDDEIADVDDGDDEEDEDDNDFSEEDDLDDFPEDFDDDYDDDDDEEDEDDDDDDDEFYGQDKKKRK